MAFFTAGILGSTRGLVSGEQHETCSPSLRRVLRLLVFVLLGLYAGVLPAVEREFYFDRIDSRQGLLQNSVFAITQDHEGYLWIATQGGLHLYDGYRFKLYAHDADDPASLPDSVVLAFAEDVDKRLWVGTSATGIARLDTATNRFESFALPLDAPSRNEREAVAALAFDARRGLWIGHRQGIEVLDPASGARTTIRAQRASDRVGAIRGLTLASDGELWAASETGLWRVPLGSDVAERVEGALLDDMNSVFETRDHLIYAGNSRGLHRIDPDTHIPRQVWSGSERRPVAAIIEDAVGRLWLAISGEGLLILDPVSGNKQWIHTDRDLPGSLPETAVRALFIDRSGLLWVGGEVSGLSKVEPGGAPFRFISDRERSRDGVKGNNLRAILEDAAGDLWLGTDGDGLKRYNRSSGRFTYYDDAIAKGLHFDTARPIQVESLAAGEAGTIWFASTLGIGQLDPASGRVSALQMPGDAVSAGLDRVCRSLLVGRDGSLWLGLAGYGVMRYEPKTKVWQHWRHRDGDPGSLSHDHVLSLAQDSSGRIWAGTVDGLNVIDPADGSLRSLRHEIADPHSLSGNIVRVVHESADGSFWIGTHSGLNHLQVLDGRKPKFTRYLTRDGLPDSTVYGILEDPMGRLWLSSNRGISSFDPRTSTFHAYSAKDGLQGNEFNGGSFAVLREGTFAFGGTNGLNLVAPSRVTTSRFEAPVAITAVQVGNSGVVQERPVQAIDMAQSDRVVHFEFAALDFTAPERNRFRYRLRDFDDNWVDAGTRHDATYTNLGWGHYTFEVQASNHDGFWSETGTQIGLRIRPAWWNSLPMQLVYGLITLLLLLTGWDAIRRKRLAHARHARELKEREDRLRLALWGSSDEFWDLDMDSGALVRLSASRTRGSQREDLHSVYDWLRERVHPDDQRTIAQRLDDHITGKAPLFESEQRVRERNNKWIWVLVRGKIVERTTDGRPLRICGTARNITASREAERERRIAQEVISSMGEAVSVVDLDYRFVSVNPAFTRITGWQESEVLARSASLLNCPQHSPEHYQAVRDGLARDGVWRGELWQRRKDGEEFLSWLQSTEVRDALGQRTHFVAVLSDITERKRNEQELRYLASYDTLTGLPNRTLLSERLGHAVIRARRVGRRVGVLFLDLDRFKHVNDSMGHAAGDRMLKAAGARLRDNVRDGDTVARIGGDEFTVVLEELSDAMEAERVAQKLITAFEAPLELDDGQDVVISPSIGISLYPDHAQTPTDLLKFADTAMYQAKDRGRKTYMVYTESMDAAARLRATMVGSLRKALERNELRLVYQPKLSLLDEHITGVEALLRWNSQELGEISPATFIPVAEETGLIVEIGDWVLVNACAQLARWQQAGLRDVSMSVNLSVLQLQRGDLIQRLCDVLADNDIAPNLLELELTESVVMANAEQSITTLRQLKAVGVTLSIDDFGTGYSSLSYLKRLPIDTLKIDKEFVGDITTDPDDEAITATVITMAHSLGLNVVAEGVEIAEQVEYLREQGCDEIQGHWLSRPLPPDECFVFLRERAQRRRTVLGGPP